MAFAKIGGKLKSLFDVDDDDEFLDDEEVTAQEQPAPSQAAPAPQVQPSQYRPANNKVVAMTKPAAATQGAKIELYEPRIYSDAKEVGRNLLENTAVLVNFTHLESEDARRIVDFLTGVVFAVNGEIKRVGDRIFLVTPANFEVSGALANKLPDDLNIDGLD